MKASTEPVVSEATQVSSGGEKTAEEASAGDELCAYSIVVRTSSEQNSNTDGSVFIQLGDKDDNKTSKCRLNCSITHRKKFRQAHVSFFFQLIIS